MPAIRAYLSGERSHRRGEWDSAQVAFETAVAADSTFALAWYRLANTLGWKGLYNNPAALSASANAVRFSDSLPPRMRSLLVAYDLFSRTQNAEAAAFRNLQMQISKHRAIAETHVHIPHINGSADRLRQGLQFSSNRSFGAFSSSYLLSGNVRFSRDKSLHAGVLRCSCALVTALSKSASSRSSILRAARWCAAWPAGERLICR